MIFGMLKFVILSSVGFAVYGLLILIYNFNTDIKQHSIFIKFLIIKLALFLSIWQGILMRVIDVNRLIPLKTFHRGREVRINTAVCLDSMLVILEMFFLTLIMLKSYAAEEFRIERQSIIELQTHDKGLKGLAGIM